MLRRQAYDSCCGFLFWKGRGMGRTFQEQWDDDWLLIIVQMSPWAGGAIPLIVAGVKQMGEMGWIICSGISGTLIVAGGIFVLSRVDRRRETPEITRPKSAQPPPLESGATIHIPDMTLLQIPNSNNFYVVHNGKYHWMVTGVLKDRIAAGKTADTLPAHYLSRIEQGQNIETEKDLQHVFGDFLAKTEAR